MSEKNKNPKVDVETSKLIADDLKSGSYKEIHAGLTTDDMEVRNETELDKCLNEVKKITRNVSKKLESVDTAEARSEVKQEGLKDVQKVLKENTRVSDSTLIALSSFFAYSSAFGGSGSGGGSDDDSDDSDDSTTSQIDGVLEMLGLGQIAHLNDAAELLGKLKKLPSSVKALGLAAKSALPYVAIIAATAAVVGVSLKAAKDADARAKEIENLIKNQNKNTEELGEASNHYNTEGKFDDRDTTVADVVNGSASFWNFLTDHIGRTKYDSNITNNLELMSKTGIDRQGVIDFSKDYNTISSAIGNEVTDEFIKSITNDSNTAKSDEANKSKLPKFDYTDPITSFKEFVKSWYYFTDNISVRGNATNLKANMEATYKGLLSDLVNQVGRKNWDIGSKNPELGYDAIGSTLVTFKMKYDSLIKSKSKLWGDLSEYNFPSVIMNPITKKVPDLEQCYVSRTSPPGVDEDKDISGTSWTGFGKKTVKRYWFNETLTQKETYDKINKVMFSRLGSDRVDQDFDEYLSASSELAQSFITDINQSNQFINELGLQQYATETYKATLEGVYKNSKFIGYEDAEGMLRELSYYDEYIDKNGTLNIDKIEQDIDDKSSNLHKVRGKNNQEISSSKWKKFVKAYRADNEISNLDYILDNNITSGIDATDISYGRLGSEVTNQSIENTTDASNSNTITKDDIDGVRNELSGLTSAITDSNSKATLQNIETMTKENMNLLLAVAEEQGKVTTPPVTPSTISVTGSDIEI